MNVVCIIPARYQSSRFPGKPLANICGHPMIEWVYRRAEAAGVFSRVLVATDDARIQSVVEDFGGNAEITPSELPSGTDRVAFLAKNLNADIFVNLQGDEPLISPQVLKKVCEPFSDPMVRMSTPVKKVSDVAALADPNLVRVAVDRNGDALYFSRSVIPYLRDETEQKSWMTKFDFLQHIGIYAYRKNFLLKLTELPVGKLESAEKLEQLRVLENGYKIRTVLTDYVSVSVDTRGDLEQVTKYIETNKLNVIPEL